MSVAPCLKCGAVERYEYGTCKPCAQKRARNLRERGGAEHKLRRSYQMAKRRAEATGLPFTIQLENLVIPEVCPVLGVAMDTPSLDQHRPGEGYTPENTRVISWRANNLKADGSLEEFKKLVAYLTG